MVVMLATWVSTTQGRDMVDLVARGLRQAGAEVDRLDLSLGFDETAGEPSVIRSRMHALAASFAGKDLIIYLTEQLTFADGGGPHLRQVASWAEAAVVPVIVAAGQCQISTRELRTLGVEAGYAMTSLDDVRRLAQTWVLTTGTTTARDEDIGLSSTATR